MKAETQKTYLQDTKIKNSHSSFIGSSLLIVATLLPCTDRIISWFWPGVDVMTDNRGVEYSVNIWIATVYLAPVFIIMAAFFKPNFKIYYFPLTMFAYSALVYFAPIFGFDVKFLKWNSLIAGIIALLATLPIMRMLKHVKFIQLAERADDEFYEDVLNKFNELNKENKLLKKEVNKLNNHEESRISNFGENA